MRPAGLGQRIAVFALFAALAVAALGALVPGVPGAAPTHTDLTALAAKMNSGARLHPMAAIPAPGGSAPWCAGCHPGLPHPGTGVDRAMLNEHAGRMDCLLCHWPAASGARPTPAWQVHAGASSFMAILPRELLSQERMAALRQAAMAGRSCFERGPGCTGCHRPGILETLARPGSTPSRLATLGRLEEHFTLATGDKWYFPRFR